MNTDNLSKLPLFNGVDPSVIVRLMNKLEKKVCRKGSTIISQGERGLLAYLLLKGMVEVFYSTDRGGRATIIFHEAPFIFGEIELWDERPYLASVRAVTECEIVAISKKQYLQLLHSNHQVCINMVQLLSKLLCETGEDRRIRIHGNVDNLLANLIAQFAQIFGEKTDKGILIRRPVNKKAMAEILGVARQSVVRSFDNLVNEGVVAVAGRQILVPSIMALKKRARAFR